MSKRAIRKQLNFSLQAQDRWCNGSARALFFLFLIQIWMIDIDGVMIYLYRT